jgi:hypothetical protein
MMTTGADNGNSQVEFRVDCSNATFSGTDVAAITPPRGGYGEYIPEYDPEVGYYETIEYRPLLESERVKDYRL